MAIMIPVGQSGDYHGSTGEMMVYEALRKLPDDYYVFYSVKWGRDDPYSGYNKGEADFLIFDPTRGFITIEVKAGGIKRDFYGNWYSVGRGQKEHRLACSPLDQAWRSVTRFRELILDLDDTVPEYVVLPAVWFSNMKSSDIYSHLPSEFQPANTFSEEDLQLAKSAIDRIFNRNNIFSIIKKPSNLVINKIINVFAPTFNIVPSVSSDIREKDFLFNQLTREQASLLDYLDEQKIAGIHGVSGTGKTMIALERARRLPKDDSVLFLCFNRLLLEFLTNAYSESMPNVTFANLNRLYAKAGGDEYAEANEITDFLKTSFGDHYQFDHIIIDEGQDFDANHLDILIDITQATGGYFYIFYDKNQLVHKWDQETLEWFKKLDCHLVLHKNCRNTCEIAKTAYSAVNIEDIKLAEQINGDTPCLNNYESIERALEGIAETIRFYTNKGFERSQITILTLKTLKKSILADHDSIGGYRLSVDGEGEGILFTTARKFKGLESDVVIVIDFDEDAFKDDNSKCVFYVASSRAKHCLTYIASLDDSNFRKLLLDLGKPESANPKKDLAKLLNITVEDID